MKLNKYHAEKFTRTTGKEIQSQHWGGNMQSSMEGMAVEYFTSSIDPGKTEQNHNFINI